MTIDEPNYFPFVINNLNNREEMTPSYSLIIRRENVNLDLIDLQCRSILMVITSNCIGVTSFLD